MNGTVQLVTQVSFELFICFFAVFYASPDGVERLSDRNPEEELPLDTFCIRYALAIGFFVFGFYAYSVCMALIFAKKTINSGKKARELQLLLLHEKHQ